ncbi:MAG: peptidylprolyl isomerase [Bacteriovoracaceae bacterium]|nr:peptidylprolyl isomerase [Bacteriovoracaceae bacterium]HNU75443.1 peptidylprolyl isomerase [Deltaproteobacteria bacterium]
MRTIRQGDIVTVQYTGTLDDGTVFDKTDENAPASFMVGADTILPHISDAFIGMKEGEEKTITIPPEDAFGPWDQNKVQKLSGIILGDGEVPQVGQVVKLKMENKKDDVYGKIIDAGPLHVEVDLNHPLAGKTLHYAIKVVEIRDNPDNK